MAHGQANSPCAMASKLNRCVRRPAGQDTGDKPVYFHLLLGEGSARRVAAMVVWLLVLRHLDALTGEEAATEDMIMSLLSIPTNFEDHGDGSERAKLVAQAARQN